MTYEVKKLRERERERERERKASQNRLEEEKGGKDGSKGMTVSAWLSSPIPTLAVFLPLCLASFPLAPTTKCVSNRLSVLCLVTLEGKLDGGGGDGGRTFQRLQCPPGGVYNRSTAQFSPSLNT